MRLTNEYRSYASSNAEDVINEEQAESSSDLLHKISLELRKLNQHSKVLPKILI